jgi:hypothetical protein
MLDVAIVPPHLTVLSMRMAVALYVTGISTPEVHPEFPPLLGTLTIGRRVAGVGVAVALMMLGLEAPAFAAAPVISSFNPTSGGPDTGGCVVVVTGTVPRRLRG